MPKKRTYNFKQLQGSSSSSQSPSAAGRNGSDSSPSVNERLSELRRQEAKDSAASKRQLAESLNQRSVPPELRGILGVPESAPPKPKANVRTRERLRTPGPAPPKSWITSNSSAWMMRERQLRKNADKSERSRPNVLLRFARLAGLEGDAGDERPSSLTHLALKAVAESWDLFDEDDYPFLADIPLRLRLRILSYIGFYGLSIDHGSLRALLQGNEDIHQLDLAGLLGHKSLTLKKVVRLLEQEQDLSSSTINKGEVVAESWDAEDSPGAALLPSLQTTRFSQLTHLCLSHPAPPASWRDLLALSRLTPQITHLSLAYWPWPTLTPNLTTTTISSLRSPEVNAGGSNYYSAHDQSLSEPASLLRQLSANWLCLQWLDLEGCADWMPALALLTKDRLLSARDVSAPEPDGWTSTSDTAPSVFFSNWKNLAFIRCAQGGWFPSQIGLPALIARREDSFIDALLVNDIHKHLSRSEPAIAKAEGAVSMDVYDVEKKRAGIWMECEYRLTVACMRINSARKQNACKPIEMDFGWIKRHAAVT